VNKAEIDLTLNGKKQKLKETGFYFVHDEKKLHDRIFVLYGVCNQNKDGILAYIPRKLFFAEVKEHNISPVDKERILKTIQDHKTTSVRELFEQLGASFEDVCAVLGEMSLTEFGDALKSAAEKS
jgi:hypothetical protein